MDSGEAALLGAIIGGISSFIGGLLTNLFQWKQLRWSSKHEIAKDLLQKRLVAIQNCVRMIDFLVAGKNANLGTAGLHIWKEIRDENVRNGAFLPTKLQSDFEQMITQCMLLDSLQESEKRINFSSLKRLRAACVDCIAEDYAP